MEIVKDDLLTYASNVWRREIDVFNQNREWFFGSSIPGPSLKYELGLLRSYAFDIPKNSNEPGYFNISDTHPSISHGLIRAAYDDLARSHCEPDKTNRKRNNRIASYVSELILPSSGIDLERLNDPIEATLADIEVGSCSDADIYFDAAKHQLMQTGHQVNNLISVYHDKEFNPVMLSKDVDVMSGLLLRPAHIGKVLLAPGTIVGIDEALYSPLNLSGMSTVGDTHINCYYLNGPPAIKPRRWSPAAFSNPLDRAMFGLSGSIQNPEFDEYRSQVCVNSTLESFIYAAEAAINMCVKQEAQHYSR